MAEFASVPHKGMPIFRQADVHCDDEEDDENAVTLVEMSPRRGLSSAHNWKHQRMVRWWAPEVSDESIPPKTLSRRQAGHGSESLPTTMDEPLRRVRCSVMALIVLGLLRLGALNICAAPGWSTLPAHLVSCASDVLSVTVSLPVIWPSIWALDVCMQRRCLGPLVTTVLVASICDVVALFIFLHALVTGEGVLLRRPFAAAKPRDRHETSLEEVFMSSPRVGVWACILLSSVLIEAALCRSTWEVYRCLREAGVYPPEAHGLTMEVSPAELVCEAEDVALLSECKAEDCNAQCIPVCYQIRQAEHVQYLEAFDVTDEHRGVERSLARHSRDTTRQSPRDSPRELSYMPVSGMTPVTGRSRSAPPSFSPVSDKE